MRLAVNSRECRERNDQTKLIIAAGACAATRTPAFIASIASTPSHPLALHPRPFSRGVRNTVKCRLLYTNKSLSIFYPATRAVRARARAHGRAFTLRAAVCNPFTGSFGIDRFARPRSETVRYDIDVRYTVLTSCLHFNQSPLRLL